MERGGVMAAVAGSALVGNISSARLYLPAFLFITHVGVLMLA